MPTICVYAIAKNEEKHVKRFMDSVAGADMVIVLDTGSTDKTVELLRERGAQVHVEPVTPWRFDVARNKSLDLVPKYMDICVCIDLDEELRPGWQSYLRAAWTGSTNRIRYRYIWSFNDKDEPEVEFSLSKIHARNGFEWRHPCHEYVFAKPGIREITTEVPIVVEHRPDKTKSRSNYIALLELGVKEDPFEPRRAYYYGRELTNFKRYTESIDEMRRYLALPKATWQSERAQAMRYIATCYLALKNKSETINWLLRSVAEAPAEREHWAALAEEMCDQENWGGGYFAAMQALKITTPEASYVSEAVVWGSHIYEIASVAAFHLGLKDQALAYIKQAHVLNPAEPEYLKKIKVLESDKPQVPYSPARPKCVVNF